MICFPNAKINIGLRIVEKRNDGFHNLETIFYPVHGLYDCIEFIESNELQFENSGLLVDSPMEKNLCVLAWKILHETYKIPPIHIFLHKNIPFGAGLGGGSADAAFLLNAVQSYFGLKLSNNEMEGLVLELGSDCPFFIQNIPVFAEGRGEIFTKINIDLKGKYIVMINPNIHVSTAEAYAGVKPVKRTASLLDDIQHPIEEWDKLIENDFESSVFLKYPEINRVKELLLKQGAIYASMSGSGSTVFGIFSKPVSLDLPYTILFSGELK